MSDPVDLANDIAERELARRIEASRGVVPLGEPGECDGCGVDMPRLVGGLCGYCRDRRPGGRQ